uniref:Cytochrome P450-1 n=1 Tax=Plagiochasma appendiculatum TaxID=157224 RepID=A0A2R3U977_9MARC|nr:cytochrome P450-1 [Plagiochasma appendiculatum]
MMQLHDIWLPLGVLLAVSSIFLLRGSGHGRNVSHRLPPSPSGAWPILGHLLLLSTLPHRTLMELAKKYGPIMYMRLGKVPVVVVSSADMLREFFQVNDLIMASRPRYSASEILSFNRQDIAAQPYCDRWRELRKLFAQELLSIKRLNELQGVRRREVLHAVESIYYRAKQSSNSTVNVRQELLEMNFNNTTQMLASKRYYGPKIKSELQADEFSHLIEEAIDLMASFDIGDYIPFLKRFDLQGNIKRLHQTNAGFDRLIDKLFLEHRTGTIDRASGVNDFVDTLLELQRKEDLPDGAIKGLIFDFLMAGTETSATVLEWLLADLQLNPKAMMEIQRELDEKVGTNRIVEESDIPKLTYLQACVKESMRLHPTVPLMLPHESTASCTVAGYYIPAKVRVFVNMAAIHLNPETYDQPETFRPERFLPSGPNSHLEMKGQHFDLVPFGTGRRICMGMNLGLLLVHLGAAVLLQAYDWRLPAGLKAESVDMSEGLGSVAHMKVTLHLVPTPRLPAHVYAAENIEL